MSSLWTIVRLYFPGASNPINDFHAVQSHPSSLVTRVLVNYNQLITEMLQNQWIMASLETGTISSGCDNIPHSKRGSGEENRRSSSPDLPAMKLTILVTLYLGNIIIPFWTPRIKDIEDANVMTQFVGYNKKIFNGDTAVSEKYSTGLIYPEPISYFGIRVTYDRWSSDRAFEKLLKGNSREDFRRSLAGILQTPYFNVSIQGAKFDGFGNRRDWWDGKTMNSFNKMTKCFVDQYGKTKVDHLNLMINGAKTLSENIADNGGLRAAYNAFQKVLRRGEGRERPSASQLAQYSPNQLFFMGYAYVWCQSVSDQFLLANVPGDVHPPNRQRVNLVLRNLPQFSQAFKCSPKSKMIAGKNVKFGKMPSFVFELICFCNSPKCIFV
ncbi:unnamed protein product, partial [Mesorhabditis belari]|uniref:Peptidase M13 C-terminal domain-containing protein n=1 Tax=Mesorhabditis belari TaxID=2138241 RepID=A0AAF3FP06_9BILA